MIWKLLVAAVFGTSLIFPSSPARAANVLQAVPGTVIVGRIRGNALLLFDCTRELTDLVARKADSGSMIREIEGNAVRAMAQKRSIFQKTASTMTIRVIYNRIGAINPAYGTPTLEGVERLMTLSAPTRDVAKQASRWIDDISSGKQRKGLKVTIEGKVPGQ